ncbi:MAG TPA: TatD family hydrolase [Candidatus Thermoplasmatota archaeon]|nr:TatD family hydrolase [Candidatus Thermoplasmatota archaeon]
MSQPPPRRSPVWDNHFHMDPAGHGVEAVKAFERAGGTHLMLVHKPYALNRSLDDHARAFRTTIEQAEKARRETSVKVSVAIAPHPAEFTELLKMGVPIDEAAALQRAALELAQRHVRAGDAVAMAEVGRPHWRPVADDIMAKANELMEYSFTLALDAGCPVQIHAETATPESFADLARHLDRAGLPRERAVKHYSTPIVDVAVNQGLWPSVLIGKGSAEEAAQAGTRFLMETDYMDDPKYPGAVLGPKTVPRRTADLVAAGLLSEEQAWIVHAENPKRVYGVDVEL